MGAWIQTLSVAELEAQLIEYAIPADRIFGATDMLTGPHFAAREAIRSAWLGETQAG